MRRRRCTGFTLIEVVVASAIMAILAAITVPVLFNAIDMAKVRNTAERIQALRDGLYDPSRGANAFSQQVGANPGRLSQLSVPIVSNNATGYPNSCGGAFSNGQRNNWNATGPYVRYRIDPGVGLGTAMGMIEDVLTRVPNSATAGVIMMTIAEADPRLVALLDEFLNSGDGSTTGSVQWSPPVNGITVLNYVVPINNKC